MLSTPGIQGHHPSPATKVPVPLVPPSLQDMMAATLASGAFQGSYKFTGAEGPVKGKRTSNEATRAQLQVGGCRAWVWVGMMGAAHARPRWPTSSLLD